MTIVTIVCFLSDFLRRYCVLEHGILTYYIDEKVRNKSLPHGAVYKASFSPQLLEQVILHCMPNK